jgi:hypothetical protein
MKQLLDNMKPYLIKFDLVGIGETFEPLIEYRKNFLSFELAMEWALLTAQTHSTYKNFEMHIRIQEITQTITIYYNGEQE